MADDPSLNLAMSDAPFVDKRHGFQMHYPKTWLAGEGQEKAGNLAVFAPSANVWEITEQINVNVVDLEANNMSGVSLDDFSNMSIQQLQQSFENLSELKVSDLAINGVPGKTASYRATIEPAGGRQVRNMQWWALKDDTAYVVTYIIMESISTPQFGRKCAAMEKFFKTFRVIPRLRLHKPLEDLILTPLIDETDRFAFYFPSPWAEVPNLKTTGALKVAREYKGPMVDQTEKERVTLTLAMYAEQLPQGITQEEYEKLLDAQFAKSSLEITRKPVTMGGLPAIQLRYETSEHIGLHTHLVHSNTVYTIAYTYHCAGSDDRPVFLLQRLLGAFVLLRTLPPGTKSPPNNVMVYENTRFNFRISYSPAMYDLAPGVMGSVLTLVHKHRQNVTYSIGMKANTNKLELAAVQAGIEKQLKHTIPDYQFQKAEPAQLAGQPAVVLNYMSTINNIKIRFWHLCSCNDTYHYFLTYASEERDFEARVAKELTDSFVIIKENTAS